MEQENNHKELPGKGAEPGFDVPVKGSLGLLALGDLGLKAWRKARREALGNQNDANLSPDEDE
ncbi:MAG TPA: hypothetical protein P5248_08070 [Bacteroidales bacterium]|nr:hypothetical protein [Bacteroidales bacterium]